MNRNRESDDIKGIHEDKGDKICQNNPRSHPDASHSMEESDDHEKTPGHDLDSQSALASHLNVRDQYFQPSIPSLPWSIPHGAQ